LRECGLKKQKAQGFVCKISPPTLFSDRREYIILNQKLVLEGRRWPSRVLNNPQRFSTTLEGHRKHSRVLN
jgi:hypothetical protein